MWISYAIIAVAAGQVALAQPAKRNNDRRQPDNIQIMQPMPVIEPPFPVVPEINMSTPRFQVYDDEFHHVLGDNPVLRRVASNPEYACEPFFHMLFEKCITIFG